MTSILIHPAAGRDPSLAAARWRLGEAFLLRVAGQPADAVTSLLTGNAIEWTRRVLDLETGRDTAAGQLGHELEKSIAGLPPGDPGRGALISLRRDVFNARPPRPATVTKAAPLLTPTGSTCLERWQQAVTSLAGALAEGAGILGADIAAARAQARAVLADDAFRCAVLLQSEVLERNMDRYLDPARKLDKSGRQIEGTLLELLYRAALKRARSARSRPSVSDVSRTARPGRCRSQRRCGSTRPYGSTWPCSPGCQQRSSPIRNSAPSCRSRSHQGPACRTRSRAMSAAEPRSGPTRMRSSPSTGSTKIFSSCPAGRRSIMS